ncbi:hypothetical protein SanaruYs_29890 [Chryseotalea sanaruensis]|uniref:Uncharacterized protein n=2 Tax=Chryseotalea sanaruensis TaxID=2482724 RepID=A0A401UCU7_9BACT|nr:hypothetical protein SanaruYs_29890 [Chryseotalea sanaruensis]
MRISKIKSSKRTGSIIKIILSIILATFLFTVIAFVWGVDLTKDISLLLVGGVIVMGLSTLFATAMDSNESNFTALFRTSILASIVTVSFLTLESGSSLLLKSQLPQTSGISSLEITMFIILLIAFGAAAIIQILAPALSVKPSYRRIAIHLRNGFYANAIFDRITNALNVEGKKDIISKNY